MICPVTACGAKCGWYCVQFGPKFEYHVFVSYIRAKRFWNNMARERRYHRSLAIALFVPSLLHSSHTIQSSRFFASSLFQFMYFPFYMYRQGRRSNKYSWPKRIDKIIKRVAHGKTKLKSFIFYLSRFHFHRRINNCIHPISTKLINL